MYLIHSKTPIGEPVITQYATFNGVLASLPHLSRFHEIVRIENTEGPLTESEDKLAFALIGARHTFTTGIRRDIPPTT
jgi:hypothetical protein